MVPGASPSGPISQIFNNVFFTFLMKAVWILSVGLSVSFLSFMHLRFVHAVINWFNITGETFFRY